MATTSNPPEAPRREPRGDGTGPPDGDNPPPDRHACPICHKELSSDQAVIDHLRKIHLPLSANPKELLLSHATELRRLFDRSQRYLCLRHHNDYLRKNKCRNCAAESLPLRLPGDDEWFLDNAGEVLPAPVLLDALPDPHPSIVPAIPGFTDEDSYEVFWKVREAHRNTLLYLHFKIRRDVCRQFTALISEVVNAPHDVEKWALLTLYPKCVLAQMNREQLTGSTNTGDSQVTYTKKCIAKWDTGIVGRRQLYQEMLEFSELSAGASARPPPQLSTNVKRCKGMTECGRLGDATRALLSNGIAQYSDETIAILQSKHPARTQEVILEGLPERGLTASSEIVTAAIVSFAPNSAGGRDGLRPDHLRDMLDGASSTLRSNMVFVLTRFINLGLDGQFPAELAPFQCSAPLYPLTKPKGGIRPIAVGETLRRLISKTACALITDRSSEMLSPLQLGVGIRDGAVAIVHTVQQLRAKYGRDADKLMMKFDFENAFNRIDRRQMFQQVRKVVPGLAKWVEFCYRDKPILFTGPSHILSEIGVQQGDPLGPFLFAITIHPLLQKISQVCPQLDLNAWYLDDGVLVGSVVDILTAFNIIHEEGEAYGLKLNVSKCEVWWPSMNPAELAASIPQGICIVEDSGVELLGAPIGDAVFCEKYLVGKLASIEQLLSQMEHINHAQYQLPLLKFCAGMPKFMFTLRTVHPQLIRHAIRKFDELVDISLQTILNRPFGPHIRNLMGLPVRMGGLGVPQACHTALSAYMGSFLDTQKIQKSLCPSIDFDNVADGLIASWIQVHAHGQELSPQNLKSELIDKTRRQHFLTEKVFKNMLEHLQSQPDPHFQLVLTGCLATDSGVWTQVLPRRFPMTTMDRDSFAAVLRARFGLPSFHKETKCENCNQTVSE